MRFIVDAQLPPALARYLIPFTDRFYLYSSYPRKRVSSWHCSGSLDSRIRGNDENLLRIGISSLGHDAEHVFDLDMDTAEDREIWVYALEVGAVIITKDEDFSIQAAVAGQKPAIVWIRIGNTSKRALLEWFKPLLPMIEQALAANERFIEII